MDSSSANMWVLPSDLTAARLARGHIVDACRGMAREKLDVARLLVSELAANAIEHGSGIVLLVVAREGEGVRVYVDDENPDPPVVMEPRSLMEHGAGMRLVEALADDWGVVARGDGQRGKRVWFALA